MGEVGARFTSRPSILVPSHLYSCLHLSPLQPAPRAVLSLSGWVSCSKPFTQGTVGPSDCVSGGQGNFPYLRRGNLKYVLRNEEAGAVVTSLESLGGVGARGGTGPATALTTV